ncbi:DUF262 domain-containing protein [Helicobacter pylori]|uniref:DUF262 domain-containing protein n=1 Tax=Helicobacter pylori TaxID=210 RepID=UPI002159F038|nr:DUF262 domain-containing protein [Helicobacter pylori]
MGLKATLKKKNAKINNPNAYEEKRLYLNLKHQPNMDKPEDNYQFEFHAQKPENDKKHWWFKVGDILELKSVVNYTREHELGDKESELLETLNKAFHDKQLISFFEETEKNLNKVLNIFIRVNSGGVKLSYSDLLMSILTCLLYTSPSPRDIRRTSLPSSVWKKKKLSDTLGELTSWLATVVMPAKVNSSSP